MILRFVATTYFAFALLLGWVIAWLLQVISIAFMFPFASKEQRQDVCGWIFRSVNAVFVDLLNPFWKVVVFKRYADIPKDRPVIVMINHLSNCDPWVAIRAMWPIDCKWVCKGSLFRVPFGGWCLRNGGDIEVKFTADKDGWGTEKGSVAKMMDYSAQLLRRKQPIAIFPEGIRSYTPDGPIGEFKNGYFDLAIKEGATIVPIALSGSHKLWPRGQTMIGVGSAYLSVGEPISANGQTVDTLKAAVYKRMSEMRDAHPDRLKK